MTELEGKPAWRARIRAARAAVPPPVRQAEASALASWVRPLRGTVCAYYPVRTEPGSVSMLDALVAGGCRVLLPVLAGRGAPLDWAEYRPDLVRPEEAAAGRTGAPAGSAGRTGAAARSASGTGGLARGPYGLLEPVGPRLGVAAVSWAATLLVPALAVDRRGVRLGRGAGYYDRTLVLAAPGAALVAVVRDDELVERLPVEDHDVPMTAALTPGAGFTALAGA